MGGMTTTSSRADADVARRPGGRSARVQQAVYAAVGALSGQGHRDTMTIPQVAERAGVNPSSIYRRWGSMEALLEEVAVAALTRDDEPLPETGDLRGELELWAVAIAEDITRPQRVEYLRAMVAGRSGALVECPCWGIRQEQAQQMVARAAARGERVPQARQILDHIIAPLYHHVVFGIPTDADHARALVADVVAMFD